MLGGTASGYVGMWMAVLFIHLVSSNSPLGPATTPLPPTDSTSSTGGEESGMIRLPRTLRPTHYEVRLQPFLGANFSIHGEVTLEVTALVTTRHIIMHMTDIITLNHTAKVVEQGSDVAYKILQQRYSASMTLYIVHLEEELQEGRNYTFSVSFVGTLSDHPRGFYRSSYIKENGEESWVAATQFQATDARRAFPCLDEPHLKATFKIFLARWQNMTALSNMPLLSSTPMEGSEDWVWDEFERSVAMSTYLVAFAIMDFPSRVVAGQDGNTTLIRAWARDAVGEYLEYRSRVASLGLSVLESYFGVVFPLPKLDLICPPEMSPNAMENWGLITFRESGLLYDPASSSADQKLWVCYLVAHELAHQWFGNLVTLAWWSDLWLNEGFATYMGDVAVDQVEPSWKMLDRFVVARQQAVMALDALRSSHPISRPVLDPAIINEIFDTISYNKGASIIRMMSHFLTEATFRRGLTDYLTTLQFGSADQDDLWEYLTKAGHRDGTLPAHLTVKTIMDTWTLQMGFPVLTVTRTGNTTAVVSQVYFLLNDNLSTSLSSSSPSTSSHLLHSSSSHSSSSSSDSASSSSSSSSRWWVPLTYTGQDSADFGDTNVKVWLSEAEDRVTVEDFPEHGRWVLFNIRQSGYYRVNYDEANWKLLTQQLLLNHSVIHVTNRAQILDDAFNLARAGRLSYGVVLEAASYLSAEREYPAWRAALQNLLYLYQMLHRDQAYGALKDYLLSLLLPIYRVLGGLEGRPGEGAAGERGEVVKVQEEEEEEDLPTQLLREVVVWWTCRLDHPECVTPALDLYRAWMDRPEAMKTVSANVLGAVGCTAVRKGGEAEWVFAWKRQEDLKDALACTREIWLLARYLDGAFNATSGIRRQDADSAFRSIASEPLGALLAWNYLRAHWPRVSQYIGTTFFALPRMVSDVTMSFNTAQQLQELEEFERQHSEGGGLVMAGAAVAQAKEGTRNNMAWVRQHRQEIVDLLASKGFSSHLADL